MIYKCKGLFNRLLSLVVLLMIITTGCQSQEYMGSGIGNPEMTAFDRSQNNPPTAKTLYTLGDILAAQGKDAHAELVLKRTIQDYPEFLPAYNSLAELYLRYGRTDDAMYVIGSGLEIYPEDAVLNNNLGMCYLIKQDYEQALEMFSVAAGIAPGKTRYRANMAVALGLTGRDDEARSLFKQILPGYKAEHNVALIRKARELSIEKAAFSTE